MITIGAVAPSFTLPGTDGTEAGRHDYTLADYAGQPVVLAFYPADHSPVCTIQLNSYTDDIGQFDDVGAQVLALSPQSIGDHDEFAELNGGFGFPLLSDADKVVGQTYGILGPLGFYRRSVFVVDASGLVRYAHRSTAGMTFRPVTELIDAVRAAS